MKPFLDLVCPDPWAYALPWPPEWWEGTGGACDMRRAGASGKVWVSTYSDLLTFLLSLIRLQASQRPGQGWGVDRRGGGCGEEEMGAHSRYHLWG